MCKTNFQFDYRIKILPPLKGSLINVHGGERQREETGREIELSTGRIEKSVLSASRLNIARQIETHFRPAFLVTLAGIYVK